MYYESTFLLFCPNFADVAKPPILAEPMVIGNSVRISWNHTDKGLCFRSIPFPYNITWSPVKGGKTQSNTTKPGATEYNITNLIHNTDYRVHLVGVTSSEPPVYSKMAVVTFKTGKVYIRTGALHALFC